MLLKILIFVTMIIAVGGFVAWSGQRILVYAPNPERVDPMSLGLGGVREVVLRTPEGIELIAWYGEPSRRGRPTLLYFHGNAGNLESRAGRMDEYLAKGNGMLILSYRGYGGSGGRPTEKNNVADARVAYDWLRANGVPADQIILYGESLGSGVAVQLAADVEVGGVILDAPYTSIAEVGARLYPYLPVRTFILDRYNTIAHIGEIDAPLLIVHGENDLLIPIEMGRELFGRAKAPKEFAEIAGAGHADHYLYGSYDVIHAWLDRSVDRRSAAATESGTTPETTER